MSISVKISEMISDLSEILAENGDLDVLIMSANGKALPLLGAGIMELIDEDREGTLTVLVMVPSGSPSIRELARLNAAREPVN